MARQFKRRTIAVGALSLGLVGALIGTPGLANDAGKAARPCFDLSKPVRAPLVDPVTFLDGKHEVSGQRSGEIEWAAAQSNVSVPIADLYRWLLDHTKWKEPSKTKLETQIVPSRHFLELHHLKISAHVFAFFYIDWVETWAYSLLKGKKTAPQKILASYQKSSGTGHIRRLCGSVLLDKRGARSTDVFLYQESHADHYDRNNIRELHSVLIERMRKLAPEEAAKKESK